MQNRRNTETLQDGQMAVSCYRTATTGNSDGHRGDNCFTQQTNTPTWQIDVSADSFQKKEVSADFSTAAWINLQAASRLHHNM
jgi:cytoskeletal protein RodZ